VRALVDPTRAATGGPPPDPSNLIRLHQAGRTPGCNAPLMTQALPGPERLSRPEAIAIIRERLRALCDDEHCACAAAAHFGVFCKGLRSLSDQQFRERFDWIARPRPHASREELEKLVSLYHLGRQEAEGFALCCDVETRAHCGCDGWNMFDNQALERFCRDLAARHVVIE
jgi:hypothetical protein